MASTIQILYSCHLCGVVKARLDVVERSSGEDVLRWMDKVSEAIGADHAGRSPSCGATKISEVWIPVPDGTQNVGQRVKN